MHVPSTHAKRFLLVSDFDQTLSFNDSGHVLSEMLGITTFAEKVAGLARLNLVQSGADRRTAPWRPAGTLPTRNP